MLATHVILNLTLTLHPCPVEEQPTRGPMCLLRGAYALHLLLGHSHFPSSDQVDPTCLAVVCQWRDACTSHAMVIPKRQLLRLSLAWVVLLRRRRPYC